MSNLKIAHEKFRNPAQEFRPYLRDQLHDVPARHSLLFSPAGGSGISGQDDFSCCHGLDPNSMLCWIGGKEDEARDCRGCGPVNFRAFDSQSTVLRPVLEASKVSRFQSKLLDRFSRLAGQAEEDPCSNFAIPLLVSRELSLTDSEFTRKRRLVSLEPSDFTYAVPDAPPVDFGFSRNWHF